MTDKKPKASVALLTADWHTLERAWKHRRDLCGDAHAALTTICRTAEAYNLPIIAAGDLFDSKQPQLPDLMIAHYLLRECVGGYIQGNHERSKTPWMDLVAPDWYHLQKRPLVVPRNAFYHERIDGQRSVVFEGVDYHPRKFWNFWGIDYVNSKEQMREQLDLLERRMPDEPNEDIGNVLVVHQATPATMPMEIPEITDGMVPDVFDLVVIGHCHAINEFVMIGQGGKRIPAISPGGIHLLSVNESTRKRIYILRDDGSIGFLPLITRRVITIESINRSTESLQAVCEKVKESILNPPDRVQPRVESIRAPIVRVDVSAESYATTEKIVRKTLDEHAHIFFRTQYEKDTSQDVSEQVSRMENIDISRYASEGYSHIAEQFRDKEELDTDVRNIVEGMIGLEPDPTIYSELKERFCHAED